MKKFIKKLFKLDKEEQRRTSNLNPVYVARKVDIEKVDLTPLENSINEVSTKLDTFIGEIAQEQITQNNKISTIENEQQTQNTNISANTQKIKNHNTTNNTQNTRLDAIDKINNNQNAEIGRIEGKFDSQIRELTDKVENSDTTALNTRLDMVVSSVGEQGTKIINIETNIQTNNNKLTNLSTRMSEVERDVNRAIYKFDTTSGINIKSLGLETNTKYYKAIFQRPTNFTKIKLILIFTRDLMINADCWKYLGDTIEIFFHTPWVITKEEFSAIEYIG